MSQYAAMRCYAPLLLALPASLIRRRGGAAAAVDVSHTLDANERHFDTLPPPALRRC